jgi:hypothetical protein
MSSSVAFCAAHFSEWPHQSGYRDDVALQEYPTSIKVSRILVAEELGVETILIKAPKSFDCGGKCIEGIDDMRERIRRKKRCKKYRASLRHITEKSADASLAVSFHIGNKRGFPHAPSGPFCLTSGGILSRAWCYAFLTSLENISGFRRRGRAPLKNRRWNGVYDITDPDVLENFSFKWFLLRGCPEAVIVEMGNIQSATDAAWLAEGQGVQQVASAAVEATRHVFSSGRED